MISFFLKMNCSKNELFVLKKWIVDGFWEDKEDLLSTTWWSDKY